MSTFCHQFWAAAARCLNDAAATRAHCRGCGVVLLPQCWPIPASLHQYTIPSTHHCIIKSSIHHPINTSLHHPITASIHHPINTSLHHKSLHQYIIITAYYCINAPFLQHIVFDVKATRVHCIHLFSQNCRQAMFSVLCCCLHPSLFAACFKLCKLGFA